MENIPKLLRYDRRTIAAMMAANRVLDRLSTISISSAGASALTQHAVYDKIDWLIPIVAFIVGATSQGARELLTFLVSVAKIKNPIED